MSYFEHFGSNAYLVMPLLWSCAMPQLIATANIIIVVAVVLPCNTASPPRIVGGVESSIAQLPYLVNLRLNGRFLCGGSVLTPRCVLTAAHCVAGMMPSALTVHAGASRLSMPGVMSAVAKHFVPSSYSSTTLDMDVAILQLQQPLSGENIVRIGLCSSVPNANETVRISGWGVTDEHNPLPPNRVRTAVVHVVAFDICQRAYDNQATLSDTMFCASVPGIRDSCSGDSGGPVVRTSSGQQCGIVSWGIGCARAQYPGVYTSVAAPRVNTFIRQILSQNC